MKITVSAMAVVRLWSIFEGPRPVALEWGREAD
jgi:hypothetical protein